MNWRKDGATMRVERRKPQRCYTHTPVGRIEFGCRNGEYFYVRAITTGQEILGCTIDGFRVAYPKSVSSEFSLEIGRLPNGERAHRWALIYFRPLELQGIDGKVWCVHDGISLVIDSAKALMDRIKEYTPEFLTDRKAIPPLVVLSRTDTENFITDVVGCEAMDIIRRTMEELHGPIDDLTLESAKELIIDHADY